MEKGITFRRIRGRLVPIRASKKDQHNLKVGLSAVGGGAGISAVAGQSYRRVNNLATKTSMRGASNIGLSREMLHRTPDLFSWSAANDAATLGRAQLKKGAKIGSFAKPIRRGGIALGAAVIGYGASKLAQATRGKDDKYNKAIGAGAGALAFGSANYATKAFTSGMYPKAAAKNAAKKLISIIKAAL